MALRPFRNSSGAVCARTELISVSKKFSL